MHQYYWEDCILHSSFPSRTLLTKFCCMYLSLRNERSDVIKMHPARHVMILFTLVLLSSISVFGFPDGAPVDACVKPRPNQPYHGEARSQPLNTSPYKILASSSQYGPGSQVTGGSNVHRACIIKHNLSILG